MPTEAQCAHSRIDKAIPMERGSSAERSADKMGRVVRSPEWSVTDVRVSWCSDENEANQARPTLDEEARSTVIRNGTNLNAPRQTRNGTFDILEVRHSIELGMQPE